MIEEESQSSIYNLQSVTYHSSRFDQSLPQTQTLPFDPRSSAQPTMLQKQNPVAIEPCASVRSDQLLNRSLLDGCRGCSPRGLNRSGYPFDNDPSLIRSIAMQSLKE